MDVPEVAEAGHVTVFETLHPYMVSYGIMPKKSSPLAIQESDLLALATRWKVKAVKDKRKDGLIRALYAYVEQVEMRTDNRKYGTSITGNVSLHSEHSEHIYFEPEKKPNVKPLAVNYFGLPIHAVTQTPMGLVYRGRKPNLNIFESEEEEQRNKKELTENQNILLQAENSVEEKHTKKDNFIAQRKVAKALLAIASNPTTVTHFVLQGGLDAIFKLAFDSSDMDTLTVCAKCIAQAAATPSNRKPMMEKQVSTES